jgi:hypothetical protein
MIFHVFATKKDIGPMEIAAHALLKLMGSAYLLHPAAAIRFRV